MRFAKDSSISCGVYTMTGLSFDKFKDCFKTKAELIAAREDWRRVYRYYGDPLTDPDECPTKGYTYIFSDNEDGDGQLIANYIKQQDLGSLVATPRWHTNPNSGNRIKIWIWNYNGKRPLEMRKPRAKKAA